MKISQLIKHLQELKEKHGDVDCWFNKHYIGCIDEMNIPEYLEMECEDTNYREGFVPKCHPYYKGIFISPD